jgi:hypothetical protein
VVREHRAHLQLAILHGRANLIRRFRVENTNSAEALSNGVACEVVATGEELDALENAARDILDPHDRFGSERFDAILVEFDRKTAAENPFDCLLEQRQAFGTNDIDCVPVLQRMRLSPCGGASLSHVPDERMANFLASLTEVTADACFQRIAGRDPAR